MTTEKSPYKQKGLSAKAIFWNNRRRKPFTQPWSESILKCGDGQLYKCYKRKIKEVR